MADVTGNLFDTVCTVIQLFKTDSAVCVGLLCLHDIILGISDGKLRAFLKRCICCGSGHHLCERDVCPVIPFIGGFKGEYVDVVFHGHRQIARICRVCQGISLLTVCLVYDEPLRMVCIFPVVKQIHRFSITAGGHDGDDRIRIIILQVDQVIGPFLGSCHSGQFFFCLCYQ